MDIRPARHTDIRAVAELWALAFPGSRTVLDRVRMLEAGGRYGGLETVIVAEVDGAVAGAAKLYALTEHLTGVPVPMMGLAAVAVRPEHRRQGIAARLCRYAIRSAVARGDVVSVLYPFRPDYYERLGWGLVGHLVEHRVGTAAIRPSPSTEAVRPARLPADADAIAAVYDRVAARSHGPLARDRRVWAYRLTGEELGVRALDPEVAFAGSADPRRAILVHDDGGVRGYALIRYRIPERADRRTIVIRELIADTPEAYRGLLGFVAGKAKEWPRVRHFARPGERFADHLIDPRLPGAGAARSLYFPTGRIVQGPMLRVLDVPEALRRRRWFDGTLVPPRPGGVALTVETRDDLRPENGGGWAVRVAADGDAQVRRLEGAGGCGTSSPRLSAGISTLSRIWAGELRPSEAVGTGCAEVTGDAALLDAAFAVREGFWLLDEF